MSDARTRILIVEDDVELAEMLDAYFQVHGFDVEHVTWGEDAVRSAAATPPDIALLDIRLPDIDGYEVCRRLRALHSTRRVPVMFLTEKHTRTDRLAGLTLGAVDYITKPFDIKELHLRIQNALRRARLRPNNNPVTDLPEAGLVEQHIEALLQAGTWCLIYVGIKYLPHFRDKYGFVAADDVVRAIGFILKQMLAQQQPANGFLGHVDQASFVLTTSQEKDTSLAQECRRRIEAAIPYFYPAVAASKSASQEFPRLDVDVQVISSRNEISTVTELRETINQMAR